MLSLHWLGPPLESAAGRGRFTAIYLASIMGGSWAQYHFGSFAAASMGASGGRGVVWGSVWGLGRACTGEDGVGAAWGTATVSVDVWVDATAPPLSAAVWARALATVEG
jgi:hypothetical protein